MGAFEKIILGFFVGVLCGLVPLLYGIIKKHLRLGVAGILCTSLFGVLFSFLEKSPFTSLVVAVLFVFVIIASNKRHSHKHDEDDDLNIY